MKKASEKTAELSKFLHEPDGEMENKLGSLSEKAEHQLRKTFFSLSLIFSGSFHKGYEQPNSLIFHCSEGVHKAIFDIIKVPSRTHEKRILLSLYPNGGNKVLNTASHRALESY